MKNITIYDTEYWTDEGCMARGWRGMDDQTPHTMQIGAIKLAVEDGFPEIGRLDITVIPKDFRGNMLPVTSFFTQLTHVTEGRILSEGLELKDALKVFYQFSGAEEGCIYSYGGDESTMLLSCFEQGVEFPFKRAQVYQINKVFERLGLSFDLMDKYNSGALAEGLGLTMESSHHQHDAICDVISLVTCLRHLTKEKDEKEVLAALRTY